jgi:hypothetical protein
MSDNRFNDDGSFTDEYKTQILTHPVVSEITLLLIRLSKSETELDQNKPYKALLDKIPESSTVFFGLRAEAFSNAEMVQHGLHMLNSMLHQFFPATSTQKSIEDTYVEINQIFWGVYFLRAGEDGANSVSGTYSISSVEAAKQFALEFWRFGGNEFPPTIELGYRFLDNIDMIKRYGT